MPLMIWLLAYVPDDLAPCVARSSAATILTIQNKLDVVFVKEVFRPHRDAHLQEMR